jgi:hypothetical protein
VRRANRLNWTLAPGVKAVIVVLAWRVPGAKIHVFPPSVLYCHSYDARRAALAATSLTEPDGGP